MFNFFATIVNKITSVVASLIIAVGIISAPAIPPEQTVIQQEAKSPAQEVQLEEPKQENGQPPLQKATQEKTAQIELELEQANLKTEKAVQEAERIKDEQETQRIAIERQRRAEEQREAQRLAEEKQKQEAQRQRNIEQKQAEESKRVANIKKVDEDLFQIIAIVEPKVGGFSSERNDTNNFIVTIRDTMNKYLTSSLIQQSGQQLINESNNLSFILGKLVDIGNNIIREANSRMGSGAITSELWSLTNQLENYTSQRDSSDAKVRSLITTFVANEKTVLDETVKKRQAELERKQRAVLALNQLTAVTQEINSQLTILSNQINTKEAEIEAEYNRLASMATIERRVAQLIPELNALINQWNSLLDTKNRLATINYKLQDYYEYGTLLPAEDRTLLSSLGINF